MVTKDKPNKVKATLIVDVEEYRQRMIEAFHIVGCDELIALVALPTENDFKELEWLLENYYKKKDEIN